MPLGFCGLARQTNVVASLRAGAMTSVSTRYPESKLSCTVFTVMSLPIIASRVGGNIGETINTSSPARQCSTASR